MKKIMFLLIMILASINFNIVEAKETMIPIQVAQILDEMKKEVDEEINSYTRGINDAINNFSLEECKKLDENSNSNKCKEVLSDLRQRIMSRVSRYDSIVNNYVVEGYYNAQDIVLSEYRDAVSRAYAFIDNAEREVSFEENNNGDNSSNNNSDNSSNNNSNNTNDNSNNNNDDRTSSYDDVTFANFCLQKKVINTMKFLGYGLYIVKILVPILLIIFGAIDFGKAMLSSNQDAIQKAAKSLIIKVITGIVIFLIPTIINFVFRLAGNDESSFNRCRVCIFDVRNCTNTENHNDKTNGTINPYDPTQTTK